MTSYAPGQKVHRFEIAGLGQAPYRLVDVAKRVYQACEGAPVLPGSSCDYCGHGIMFEYWLVSADGKRFKVDCDCVLKTSSERSLVVAVKAERQKHEAGLRRARALKRGQADSARIAAAAALLPTVADVFRALPDPNGFESRTLLDWAEWMLANAGMSGRLKVARRIEAAVEAKSGVVRIVDGPEGEEVTE